MRPNDISNAMLQHLVATVCADWVSINPSAASYRHVLDVNDCQEPADLAGHEDAATQLRYFLTWAGGWRGETARAVKTELRRRLVEAAR